MITRQDLEEAIAECQGQRNPTANTCLKLAAFYTIRKELFGEENELPPMRSYAPPPPEMVEVDYDGSEFVEAVRGKNFSDVVRIVDELMDAMKVLQPRIYDSVMRKIQNL